MVVKGDHCVRIHVIVQIQKPSVLRLAKSRKATYIHLCFVGYGVMLILLEIADVVIVSCVLKVIEMIVYVIN